MTSARSSSEKPRNPVPTAVGAGIVVALVAIVAIFLLSRGTERDGGALGLVQKATSRGIAHYRAEAESAGGALSVTWSVASSDGGSKKVEALISSSVSQRRSAVFTVIAEPQSVMAENDIAAFLLDARTDTSTPRP